MSTEKFPLWAFWVGREIILTRGRTQEEAARHAIKSVPRGSGMCYANYCPINGADLYSTNHPFDWLNTPPRHLNQ